MAAARSVVHLLCRYIQLHALHLSSAVFFYCFQLLDLQGSSVHFELQVGNLSSHESAVNSFPGTLRLSLSHCKNILDIHTVYINSMNVIYTVGIYI